MLEKKKRPKSQSAAAAEVAQSESAAPLPQVRVQLRLLGPQPFRFIHGHWVRTQSSPLLARRDRGGWAAAQQEGSWQTGTSPARTGTDALSGRLTAPFCCWGLVHRWLCSYTFLSSQKRRSAGLAEGLWHSSISAFPPLTRSHLLLCWNCERRFSLC